MNPAACPLPFALNRRLRTPLATQLAENLRNAILSGYYREGDILPSYKQLAQELGVSLRIPREAMSDLVARGMVNPRPRIGCEVLPQKAKSWKGRIHVIAPGDTFVTYFAATLFERFRQIMTGEGWLVDLITFSRGENGKSDFAMLDDALTRKCDFALLIYPTAATIRHIGKGKIRYISFGSDSSDRVNDTSISLESAMEDVIREIRRKRIRKVTLIEYTPVSEIHGKLHKAGIAFKSLTVPWMTGTGYLERISRRGYELTKRLLATQEGELPELIFFTDDFVARGGLCALLESGLKVPGDVNVITFANRGFSPFFPTKLAKVEADPFDLANRIADEVLRRIAGLPPQAVSNIAHYLPGTSLR